MSETPESAPIIDCTALIPAAGPVPVGLLTMSTLTSPAMIPVAGRPVVHWTIEYLQSLGIKRFRIAIPERGLFVESYVESVFGSDLDIEFIVPSMDRGPGFTVHELADGVTTAQTLVVLGDTFFRFSDPKELQNPNPFVLVSTVDESYRWCVAEADEHGRATVFHDKIAGMPGPHQALIGAYWFPATEELQKATRKVLLKADAEAVPTGPARAGGDMAISDILVELGQNSPIELIPAGRWIDCGNPDRQVDAQRTMLAERAFNELSMDKLYGTITKRSRHVTKFLDEIDYLRLLPREIEVLFPRLLDFDLNPSQPSMTMEFYGYPTLSELFVFQSVDPAIWKRIFERLHRILLEGFGAFKRPVTPSDHHEMLIGKVLNRRDSLDGTPELSRVLNGKDPLLINGVELQTFSALIDKIELMVEEMADSAYGCIIHGDLCFSNILYDPRAAIFKFIDPRGSYGHAGIYGDLRYDVAKLCHSVTGHYDLIIADLFRAEVRGDDAILDIRMRPEHLRIQQSFEDVFFSTFSKQEILLITGLILLGLPALHFDNPDRQLAFALRGTELVNEAVWFLKEIPQQPREGNLPRTPRSGDQLRK